MNAEQKWYVIHTYSGFEEKAKQALLERARNNHMEAKFGEVVVPQTLKESVTKTGKKKTSAKTSFPGYILVQMALDDETMALVKDTPRITGFVGNAKNPRPLPDNEVLRITSPGSVTQEAAPVSDVKYRKGENVKVMEGPFSGFDGVIDEVKPDKARLRVLVKIFGRETPVELEYNQVEKID